MNALVTGVAGFIGSTLAGRLLDSGARVTGIDCFTDYYPRAAKQANLAPLRDHARFRLVEERLQDAELKHHLEGAAAVFHLAAQAGVRASWGREFAHYTEHNVLATQRLLEAALEAGRPRIVYASSSSVYGDAPVLPLREDGPCRPVSPYGVTKLAAEHLCLLYQRNHGVPAVALRFFTVYGPRQRPDMAFHRLLAAVLEGGTFEVYGDGRQSRDFTFVDDAVAAVLAAAERGRPGAVYNVASGQALPLLEAVAVAGRLAGAAPRLEFRPPVAGDAPHTAADIARAATDLGYAPRTPLAAGLAAQWEWQRGARAAAAAGGSP